jgi:hypothetical protein
MVGLLPCRLPGWLTGWPNMTAGSCCRFRPHDDVVEVYVVENKASGELTDLLSFYSLPSTILGHKDHDLLRAAYMFYTVPGSVPISHLMQVRAALRPFSSWVGMSCDSSLHMVPPRAAA